MRQQSLISIALLFAGTLVATATNLLDFKLTPSDGKEKTTLRAAMGNKKAVLLDFWASWCGPCMHSMPHLIETASKLPDTVLAMGVNVEGDVKKANEVKESLNAKQGASSPKIDFPWMVDATQDSLASALAINSIPRWVLISSDGTVLFNGHPTADKKDFETALKKLSATK